MLYSLNSYSKDLWVYSIQYYCKYFHTFLYRIEVQKMKQLTGLFTFIWSRFGCWWSVRLWGYLIFFSRNLCGQNDKLSNTLQCSCHTCSSEAVVPAASRTDLTHNLPTKQSTAYISRTHVSGCVCVCVKCPNTWPVKTLISTLLIHITSKTKKNQSIFGQE